MREVQLFFVFRVRRISELGQILPLARAFGGVNGPDDPGGNPGHDGVGGDVPGDDCPGGHDGAIADMYPRDHGDVGGQPDIFSRDNGGGVGGPALCRVKVVVQGGQIFISFNARDKILEFSL